MSNLKGCFSHKSDDWSTPKAIYDDFIEHGFFDPCPLIPDFDGLSIDWKQKNFVNPPYSCVEKWVDKAIKEVTKGNYVVMLLPVRTDTKWFEKLYNFGVSISFYRGRLKFGDSKLSAPFPSMLVRLNTVNPDTFEVR